MKSKIHEVQLKKINYLSKKVVLVIALLLSCMSFGQEKLEKRKKMSPEERLETQVERMTKELSLNEKQIVQVSELVKNNVTKREEFKTESKEIRKENRDKMKAEMESTKAEMKKILNAEQFKKFEKNFEARKAKMMDKAKERKESKM